MSLEGLQFKVVEIPCPGCGEPVLVVNALCLRGIEQVGFIHGCGYDGELRWDNPALTSSGSDTCLVDRKGHPQ